MTMKDFNSKLLSLLRYVPYLVDEKPKVQRFLSCLPYHIKDRIEYDNPKTLEEAMRKANFCFEQNKKKEGIANWKARKNGNQAEYKKKEFTPQKNFKNSKNRNHSNGKNFQGIKNGASNNSNNFKGSKEGSNNNGNFTKSFERKEPVKCWECNGPHYASVCPNRKKPNNNIHTIQDEMTVGDFARTMPRINAALENRQAEYQTSMVEVEGMVNKISVTILIDPGASLSYISPQIVEN